MRIGELGSGKKRDPKRGGKGNQGGEEGTGARMQRAGQHNAGYSERWVCKQNKNRRLLSSFLFLFSPLHIFLCFSFPGI